FAPGAGWPQLRPQHDVARRVFSGHEFEHIDGVPGRFQGRGAEGIREEVGQTMPKEAWTCERGVGQRRLSFVRRSAFELDHELMLAARRHDDGAGAKRRAGDYRVVGGGVASVEADQQIERGLALVRFRGLRPREVIDGGFVERYAAVAQLAGDASNGGEDAGATVHARELNIGATPAGVQVEREAEVGLATPGIEDAQRPVFVGGELPYTERPEQFDVVLDLAVLIAFAAAEYAV